MRKMIFVILFALGFVSAAHADGRLNLGNKPCDEKCRAFKNARSTGPVPYQHQTICIWYRQSSVDNIVVRFYDEEGRPLDANNPRHNRMAAPKEGTICPGAHWFRKAARVELCNSKTARELEPEHIEIMLQLGRTPEGKRVNIIPRT